MKLFGHPIHLMLVHFPAALLPMDVLCSAANLVYPDSGLSAAAYYAMMGGVALGWLAVVTGTFDLLTVMKENGAALKSALIHGGINAGVITVYTIFAAKALNAWPAMEADSMTTVILKGILIAVMMLGNYIGA